METLTDPDERIVLERYTIIELDRSRTVWNWLQGYDPAALVETLQEAGVDVDAVLGDVAAARYDPVASEFAVVAQRRGDPVGRRANPA